MIIKKTGWECAESDYMDSEVLTISLVAYHNKPEVILKAVQSALKSNVCAKVYVVDNSATPALQKVLIHPKIHYHFVGENLGFGRAHNYAIKNFVLGKYHLILNPDVQFEVGTLETLVKYLDENPDVGLAIPKVKFMDGKMQYACRRELPTPWILVGRRFLPRFIKNRINKTFAQYELRDADPNAVMDVPCISGCFMMARTKDLLEVGGFDERYFMYMEDVDLCRRVGEKKRIVYFPKAEIFHGWARDSYKNFKLMRMHATSAVKYFNKWGWTSSPRKARKPQEAH